jgi:hypothetical protein
VTVVVKQDRVAALTQALEMLTHRAVFVGIPAEFAQRDDDSPINNAAIGYINEYGSPASNIPPRPHLIPGVRAYMPRATERFKKALLAACDSSLTQLPPSEDVRKPQPSLTAIKMDAKQAKPLDAVMKQLNAIGLEAVAAVKAEITSGLLPPLKEATIAAREREGFPGRKPLIRTGDYIRHINYVIRKV